MSQRPGVVAVIDDSSEIRSALKSLLSAYGYTTELYASAAAFLKARSKSEARCLIVDVQLGDSCGIALVRQLAQFGPALPIIFMTASDNPETERRAVEAGCVAFLRKPFPAKSLLEKLSSLKV
jgi:FixJ family two-component response regulator